MTYRINGREAHEHRYDAGELEAREARLLAEDRAEDAYLMVQAAENIVAAAAAAVMPANWPSTIPWGDMPEGGVIPEGDF